MFPVHRANSPLWAAARLRRYPMYVTPLNHRSQVDSADSAEIHRQLLLGGGARDAAFARLHALLLQVARGEASRRRLQVPEHARDELDDICVQAANDSIMTILRKIEDFRGEARFTTWCCKFVIFEVSSRLRRHAWRHRGAIQENDVLGQVADAAPSPLQRIERRELAQALERAVRDRLTAHQRRIFEAVALKETPIDIVASELGSSRGAIYKTLHDARRRLRSALIESGYTEAEVSHG